jgi:amino acid transporter
LVITLTSISQRSYLERAARNVRPLYYGRYLLANSLHEKSSVKVLRTTQVSQPIPELLHCRLCMRALNPCKCLPDCKVAFPIATYAYLGVEIVAVTAVEARTPQNSLRFPARNIAWITASIYVISVIAYYFNVSWQDPNLPTYQGRTSTPAPDSQPDSITGPPPSSSLVIIAALNANEVPISNVLLGFLIMAILSAANTALYVSSRTLWGLACNLDPQLGRSRYTFWRLLSKLSNTTPSGKVPGWALIVSAIAFWWLLPFSRLAQTSSAVNVSFYSVFEMFLN